MPHIFLGHKYIPSRKLQSYRMAHAAKNIIKSHNPTVMRSLSDTHVVPTNIIPLLHDCWTKDWSTVWMQTVFCEHESTTAMSLSGKADEAVTAVGECNHGVLVCVPLEFLMSREVVPDEKENNVNCIRVVWKPIKYSPCFVNATMEHVVVMSW